MYLGKEKIALLRSSEDLPILLYKQLVPPGPSSDQNCVTLSFLNFFASSGTILRGTSMAALIWRA